MFKLALAEAGVLPFPADPKNCAPVPVSFVPFPKNDTLPVGGPPELCVWIVVEYV